MTFRTLLVWVSVLFLCGCGRAQNDEALKAAAQRVAQGQAVLVDVREPAEWEDTGVAAPAQLLALSSYRAGGADWKNFLERNKNTEIILMCRSGNRSGQVASSLKELGYKTTNLGGFAAWQKAGLPVRKP